MTRMPRYEDFADPMYETMASGAPMGVCPNRSTKVNPREIATEVGSVALGDESRLRQSPRAVSIEPTFGGKQDFVPAGDPQEIHVNLQGR